MAVLLRHWFGTGVILVLNAKHVLQWLNFEVEPFKSQSPDDPRTITEQFDVNQQASAVGLYCFWFACDHANPLLPMYVFFTLFLSHHLFYWLKFEFVRHSLWTGRMNQLSGERRSGFTFGVPSLNSRTHTRMNSSWGEPWESKDSVLHIDLSELDDRTTNCPTKSRCPHKG